MISRRHFVQAAMATSALYGVGAFGQWSRLAAQQTLSQDGLIGSSDFGNVTLIHITDIHAQTQPLYFREPEFNIGVGQAAGQPPHLVGAEFRAAYGIEQGSAMDYALTYSDFEALARGYGRMGGLDRVATVVNAIRAERPEALLLDGGDTWQGSLPALRTEGADMVTLFNALGVDAMTSHWEFTLGSDRVNEIVVDSWQPVSDDLTRRIDRNTLPVMGKVWSVDAVSKNRSTSPYGNIVSLTESPVNAGLIYAGTDDGLIQVTEDGGGTWRKIESVPGVPERTYVNDLVASRHDAGTVYAAFNNHKNGDFAPYLLKSTDRGATWTSIAGDAAGTGPEAGGLPGRGSVYTVVEDHEQPNLLFAGTEFGAYFTQGDGRWVELTGGMPTIAVRDIELQRRENDVVLGTFGRGFYVLDDYTPLRHASPKRLEEEAILFPVKDTPMYMESHLLAMRENPFVGDAHYFAPNPPFGAVFIYYLKDGLETLAGTRRAAEKKTEEEGGAIAYPSWDELRAEAREEAPAIVLTVKDADGHVVRRLEGPTGSGFHRVAWDLRFPPPNPASVTPVEIGAFSDPIIGPMVVPGTYSVALARRAGGETTSLGEAQTFDAAALGAGTLEAKDKAALLAFQRRTARLQRAVLGADSAAAEAENRIAHLKVALHDAPAADPALGKRLRAVEHRLKDLLVALRGDGVVASHAEPTSPSILQRVDRVVSGQWSATAGITGTHRRNYEIAAEAFGPMLEQLRQLIGVDLVAIEDALEAAGGPWTPGRVPVWEE